MESINQSKTIGGFLEKEEVNQKKGGKNEEERYHTMYNFVPWNPGPGIGDAVSGRSRRLPGKRFDPDFPERRNYVRDGIIGRRSKRYSDHHE
jgi:hypothetical protein